MPTCFAQPSPTYQPAMRIVTAITQDAPAQVTTSFAHGYQTGDIVRLWVPSTYGMSQVNEQQGTITVIDDTNFIIGLDTTKYDAFAVPIDPERCAFVTPIGEVNSKLTQATRNVL